MSSKFNSQDGGSISVGPRVDYRYVDGVLTVVPRDDNNDDWYNPIVADWDVKTPVLPMCICETADLAAFGCPSAKGKLCRSK